MCVQGLLVSLTTARALYKNKISSQFLQHDVVWMENKKICNI